ncbi:MAG: c-type cytochrome [Smithellaceae bacterium]
MKKIFLLSMTTLFIILSWLVFSAIAAETFSGEKSFMKNCVACHRDGGNIVNAKKPIRRNEMKANGIETAGDIVRKMREPGPGMPKYDEKEIPDREAKAVAEYILKKFK